ncbi:hypothetical protein LXL04_010048 [Taraxacum kok-saghyz]
MYFLNLKINGHCCCIISEGHNYTLHAMIFFISSFSVHHVLDVMPRLINNYFLCGHRRITIYNLRTSSPSRKLIMRAIDDFNCYSFEARKLEEAKCVHKDHVYAVMEIDYSPTDRKFLTRSYDRTACSE